MDASSSGGGWSPSAAVYSPAVVTAFDSLQELIWTGNNTGGVESLFASSGLQERYTAYKGHVGAPVKQLLVDEKGIFSIGGDSVKCANRRGLAAWNVYTPKAKDGTLQRFPSMFSAMSFTSARASDLVVSSFSESGLSGIGNQPDLLVINASTGTVLRQAESGGSISHLAYTTSHVVSGSITGSVSTRDPRSLASTQTVQAHAGGLIGLEGEGNLLMTLGYTVMQGHPMPEQLVKVWDLRTLRPLMPILVPSGPAFVKAHPLLPSTVVVITQNGQIQVTDITDPSKTTYHQIETNGFITSASIAPTGQGLLFTDSENLMHLWSSNSSQEENRSIHYSRRNEEIELPTQAEPPRSIAWNEDTPLNLIGMPHYTSQLFSNIPYSDWITPYTPLFRSNEAIDPIVLKTMKQVDFVGYAANPRTSLRYQALKSATAGKKDKRRLEVPAFRSQKSKQQEKQSLEEQEEGTREKEEMTKWYRKVEIQYSKFGVEDFDFAFYNKTPFSGLETHILNSYTNPLLQLLCYARPMRKVAEAHTFEACEKEACLLCEAGFLFKMLRDAKGANCQASNFSRAFTATPHAAALGLMDTEDTSAATHTSYSSLIQTFNQFLLDQMAVEADAKPQLNPNLRKSDAQDSSLPSTISQLFGMHTHTKTSCPACGHQTIRDSIKHVLDLVYPRKPLSNEAPIPLDFLSILRSSITRESLNKMRCTECKAQVHLRLQRTWNTAADLPLPPLLAINAGVKTAEQLEMWQDASAGPDKHYLKQRFGIVKAGQTMLLTGETSNTSNSSEHKASYALRGMVVQIQDEGESAHLVALIKVPDEELPEGSPTSWYLFNDFLVHPVSEDEALSFSGSWKIPAVLYYQRVDSASTELDFSSLPQQPDYSILSEDRSISRKRDPRRIQHTPLQKEELPTAGTLISIDAEFVSLQQEEAEVHSDGTRKVIRPSRMTLARVSVLRGQGEQTGVPFVDDHIDTHDTIADYLTEFSGILPGDLDANTSPHTLVPLKVAYKKLRLLVDLGCIFIGHGLVKDFRIINIFVPPRQIIDTVNIYHLPARHRKLSLRFLAYVCLKQDIQSKGMHDSIEDARTALQLYEEYQRMDIEGIWEDELENIYREGKQLGFRVPGASHFEVSPAAAAEAPLPMVAT